jgi:hypothetical protein
MRVSAILFFVSFVGFLSIIHQAKSEEVNQCPVGRWQSVDYVENIENFKPGQKSWQRELFLKEVEFRSDGTTNMFFRCENGWILHEDGKTKAQFYIRQMVDSRYLFLPWLSGDVTDRGQKPWYYVFKKVSEGEKPRDVSQTSQDLPKSGINSKASDSFQTIRPVDSVKEFDNVRWKDLSKLEPSAVAAVISTLTFNKKTVWPDTNIMLPGGKPDELLEKAMNPGLEIRKLHQQGITGKGVNVAIIDQALYQDHPEFAGKVVAYHDLAAGKKSSMHGPAVVSLLAGNNCGTAPDAKIYYVAARDGVYEVDYAEGLDWIIEQNRKLPASEKIRVVSVSAAPGIAGTPSAANQKKWNDAVTRAEAAGILVLDCTPHHCFIGSCWLNAASPDDVALCKPGYPSKPTLGFKVGNLLAPTSPRTTAEQYNKDQFSYQYCGEGGLSWAIPYVGGVLAMGWQLRPDLDADQMRNLLFQSAYSTKEGAKIINPVEFIAKVRKAPRLGRESNALATVSQNPIGKWQTVDFVPQIDAFVPGVKTWQGEFNFNDLEFMGGGKTSRVWTWRAGGLVHPDTKTRSKYVIKEIDGATYMFLEWITGDVTERGQKPWYYVLKKVSGGDNRPPRRR